MNVKVNVNENLSGGWRGIGCGLQAAGYRNSRYPIFHISSTARRVSAALAMVVGLGLATSSVKGATFYWDSTSGAGNGVGGSATWGTTFSAASTGSAALSTPASTDDLIFQGTAGTITLGANQTANSLTFNTTGYTVTASSTTTRTLTGAITLASNVNLIIGIS